MRATSVPRRCCTAISAKNAIWVAGIDYDELGAVFLASKDPFGGNGVVFSGIGTDDEDTLGVG
jgi:hypothetical protein